MIRKLTTSDIPKVSEVALASFMDSVAPQLTDEGIATFTKIASPEAFTKRMALDHLMFVAEDAEGICGVVELKEGRHIALLFVASEKQGRGIGRALIETALQHHRVSPVTVSASLTSVRAYEKYGFEITGPEAEEHGLRYRPMSMTLEDDFKGT